MTLFIVLGATLLLILLGFPIAHSLFAVSLAYMIIAEPLAFDVAAERIFGSISAYALLAIPFYLLLGEIAVEGKLVPRIADLSETLVGRFPGSLGHVNIVSSMFLSGVQGSEAADIAGIGRAFIPAMEEAGFPRNYAAAVTAASAMVGPIIPPSITFVIYGAATSTSVGRLFLGGAVPGILFGLALMVMHGVLAKRRGWPASEPAPLSRILKAALRALPIMAIPAVILFGVAFGVLTATEAGAVAVFVAILVAAFYRELSPRGVWLAVRNLGRTLGPMMFVIATSAIFGYVLTIERAAPRLSSFIESVAGPEGSSVVVLLLVTVVVLVLGTLIETISLIIILGPVLGQVSSAVGVDPIHFGVVFVCAVLAGTLTPPVGYGILVGASVAELEPEELFRPILLMLMPILAVLLILVLVPQLSTWLPDLLLDS